MMLAKYQRTLYYNTLISSPPAMILWGRLKTCAPVGNRRSFFPLRHQYHAMFGCGRIASCAPVGSRRCPDRRRVANPPQVANLPHN
jgi:hypothetical protein